MTILLSTRSSIPIRKVSSNYHASLLKNNIRLCFRQSKLLKQSPRRLISRSKPSAIPVRLVSKHQQLRSQQSNGEDDPALAVNDGPDTRSPLERFRTPPKKTLSVTDLVSPAWCELQYEYTLKHHGRKKRTLAMEEGSKVHQKLEDQVHTVVKVDIETKEDAWGLRIWNVIQGLRTLRDTGLTRELEVWGVIDGLVVNGVIDELTYDCPDVKLEARANKTPVKPEIEENQRSIQDFFGSSKKETTVGGVMRGVEASKTPKVVYLGDVKTRAAKSLPNSVSFRPTKMQLMLYHTLLATLAKNGVDFGAILERYNLDGDKTFSDRFIVQVGDVNGGIYYNDTPSSQEHFPQSQDSVTTLLEHNNLKSLWSFMISELQQTIPDENALGKVLKAEYRSRHDGEIVGTKTFLMDAKELSDYISHEMKWWRGKREAQGVSVQEAFKCRSCDFAETCEWRLKKIDDAKEKTRLTRKQTSAA